MQIPKIIWNGQLLSQSQVAEPPLLWFELAKQVWYRHYDTLLSDSEFGNLTAGELNLDNQCWLNFLFWCNTAKIWVDWTMLNEEKNRRGGEGGDELPKASF